MDNSRRRKEALVFAVLLSASTDVTQNSNFKTIYRALYHHINVLDQLLNKAVPVKAERDKDIRAAQKVVNGLIPSDWQGAPDEWRLWFTVQLAYRMVASGWPVPKNPMVADFVQSMYTVSQSLNLIENPPPKHWLTRVASAPEALRKQGLF